MRKSSNNFSILPFICALLFGFLIQGCQEHSTAPPNNNSSEETVQEATFINPTLKDKALAFNSSEKFKGFIQELQKQPDEELNTFVQSKVKGFTSLRQAKENLQKKKSKSLTTQEEQTIHLNIEDPAFASVLNKNGVFQVGTQIFKITNKYTYIFKNREAFDSFNISKRKTNDPTLSYVKPCNRIDRELTQLQDDVYRVENCGGGGGGGNYDPGDGDNDNSYPNPDVENLDPHANLSKDYPSKQTSEYRSGGTKGHLKGKSWCQNFFVYSSVGTKTEHQRHTWGIWWDRKAEKITLESFIKYSYGEKLINPTELKQSLKVKLSDITNLIGGGVDFYIHRVLNLAVGDQLSEKIWHAAKNVEFTILTQKVQDNRFTYNIYPSDLVETFPPHSKSNAKRIKKVYDWSTAIIAYPPKIKQTAVDFKLDIIRSKHTLKHDGYHLGFITDKRE